MNNNTGLPVNAHWFWFIPSEQCELPENWYWHISFADIKISACYFLIFGVEETPFLISDIKFLNCLNKFDVTWPSCQHLARKIYKVSATVQRKGTKCDRQYKGKVLSVSRSTRERYKVSATVQGKGTKCQPQYKGKVQSISHSTRERYKMWPTVQGKGTKYQSQYKGKVQSISHSTRESYKVSVTVQGKGTKYQPQYKGKVQSVTNTSRRSSSDINSVLVLFVLYQDEGDDVDSSTMVKGEAAGTLVPNANSDSGMYIISIHTSSLYNHRSTITHTLRVLVLNVCNITYFTKLLQPYGHSSFHFEPCWLICLYSIHSEHHLTSSTSFVLVTDTLSKPGESDGTMIVNPSEQGTLVDSELGTMIINDSEDEDSTMKR